jgi:23S rRNA A1618 N6-methylase RlmF
MSATQKTQQQISSLVFDKNIQIQIGCNNTIFVQEHHSLIQTKHNQSQHFCDETLRKQVTTSATRLWTIDYKWHKRRNQILTCLQGMPSFLSRSVRASRSLWRSPPTASSSFAACASTPFPTPFRNSTTPTLAAPGKEGSDSSHEKQAEAARDL